jgi:hypothetical protein
LHLPVSVRLSGTPCSDVSSLASNTSHLHTGYCTRWSKYNSKSCKLEFQLSVKWKKSTEVSAEISCKVCGIWCLSYCWQKVNCRENKCCILVTDTELAEFTELKNMDV